MKEPSAEELEELKKHLAEREDAKKRLASFLLGGRRDLLTIGPIWSLNLGKALIFFEVEDYRFEWLTRLGKPTLDQAIQIRQRDYKLDRVTAKWQVKRLYAKARKEQREQLRYLPDLLQEAFQKALEDLELRIKAPILKALGMDYGIENPWGIYPYEGEAAKVRYEKRVRKGVVVTQVPVTPHREKGRKGYDRMAFMAQVDKSILKLGKAGDIPTQAQVYVDLAGVVDVETEGAFQKRFKECVPEKSWRKYAGALLERKGIRLKTKKR